VQVAHWLAGRSAYLEDLHPLLVVVELGRRDAHGLDARSDLGELVGEFELVEEEPEALLQIGDAGQLCAVCVRAACAVCACVGDDVISSLR
jgi:hypothetical protein